MIPNGCDAFYATHSERRDKPAPARRKLLQAESDDAAPAADSSELRQRITDYVNNMAARASGIATAQLKTIQKNLLTAKEDVKKRNIEVKNARSMIEQEKLRAGTEEGLARGTCVGTSCFTGVTIKDTEAGAPVTWTCRRGLDLKGKVRLAFSCSMESQPGTQEEKQVTCAGKEAHFGDYIKWVPFIKETTCPQNINHPCVEMKQCGSDRLPLRKGFVQKRLRLECAQL
jgi:hypothetical protein